MQWQVRMTEQFFRAYVECALWCGVASDEDGTDHGGEFYIEDINPEDLAQMRQDCEDFYEANAHFWEGEANYDDDKAGQDFYLTRNRHGAGFLDSALENGPILTRRAHVYGPQGFTVGYEDEENKEGAKLYMHS